MATGAPDANGIWIYGEDDSEATFSALLNKLGTSTSSALTAKLAALPGKILQVVSASTNTQVTSTTDVFVSTGLAVSITPQSASSKLIVIGVQVIGKDGADTSYNLKLRRDSTDIQRLETYGGYSWGAFARERAAFNEIVTSGSTAATSFNLQFSRSTGTAAIRAQTDVTLSSIMVIEVSA